MTGKKRKRQQNNDGSTLIVVMVAVSFLVVVASIILAVSAGNLKMKQIEYAMKKNFYVDEIGLDDIYNGIGRDVSQALQRSYSKTLIEANSGLFTGQNAAYVKFAELFSKELIALYGEEADGADPDTLTKLNSYLSRSETGEILTVESYGGAHIEEDAETGASLWQYILKDVKVKYVKDDKYESVITTDIVIEVPYINFFQDFSQFLDYSLIGNKGITFQSANALVEGNVYAGIDDNVEKNAAYSGYLYDSTLYDGMNFYKSTVKFDNSSYVISKGDFNICEADVTIESKLSATTKEALSNLWAENIRTVENGKPTTPVVNNAALPSSSLKAKANVYVADDLELNAGNSTVSMEGNYYGYNYNNSGSGIYTPYTTFGNRNIKDKYLVGDKLQAAHTTSSSIVINGMNSTLDLTGLNTLMVAGVAYVDIKDGTKAYKNMVTGEGQEYRTGESIAMRYNQFMYLAPPAILEEGSNPQLNGSTIVEEVCPKDSLKLADWFGSKYLNKDKAVIPVVYTDKGVSYTYYYLNIIEGQERNYVDDIMNAVDPATDADASVEKWELKQEIISKANNSGIASHITIKSGSASSAKVYTTGLLTDTQETAQTFQKNSITLDDMANRSTNMQKRFAQLYVNLEANKIDSVEDAKKLSTDYPLANFMNLSNFTTGKLPNKIDGKEIEGVKDAKVWILDGGINPVLDLSGEKQKGIVLCDGDLTIKGNGGSFEGLIIAKGKITVEGNLTIKANRGLVQSVLEAEQRGILETKKDKLDELKENEFASYYFLNTVLATLDEDKLVDMEKRVTGTEYTDYIYYENWKRGE